MLSGDQNIVDVNFSVLWRVSDPKKYLFNVSEPEQFLRRVAESAMRELVGRSTAEQVRTERRAEVEEGVRTAPADRRSTATTPASPIVGVQLERADPPAEVADAFEEVQRAQQDLDRFQREADQYANRRLGDARGQAAQVTETAQGYKQQVVAEAEGESQRFLSVLAEYQRAEDVTRKRLYLETVERIFQSSNKIILDGAQASQRAALPVRSISCSGTGRAAASPSAQAAPTGPSVTPLQGAAQ